MNIILWIVQVLLSLLFTFAGVSKFLMPVDEMVKNMPSYMSIEIIYFIGVCEILGGIGLVVPWLTKIKPSLTPLAAICLVVIMIGATAFTASVSVLQAIFPLIIGILCAFVAWGRKTGAVN